MATFGSPCGAAHQESQVCENCTEMYMANKRIDKIANFDAFVSLEVLWINDNQIQELDGQDGCFRLKQIYAHSNCIRYVKSWHCGPGDKEVRGVFDWLKAVIERDITRMEKWLDSSRKERKEIANLKVNGKEINWDEDTLERILALKEIQKKIDRQNDPPSNHKGGNNEAKLADAVNPSEQVQEHLGDRLQTTQGHQRDCPLGCERGGHGECHAGGGSEG
ncbi:hypothetical protein GN244_ATG01300 [Phytophthora infestans]|uniref:Uncharacterized protein n=1 Tax=Phytophthora infestans TaxID=4787 RepID=A0A833TAU7_PHYIN|nr:hypothetical protein GN244_ATG01300 [Phytophthora infestans]KAF4130804.1 hypothetical protein GN958_ATG20008 [Phytophthora infestans]